MAGVCCIGDIFYTAWMYGGLCGVNTSLLFPLLNPLITPEKGAPELGCCRYKGFILS